MSKERHNGACEECSKLHFTYSTVCLKSLDVSTFHTANLQLAHFHFIRGDVLENRGLAIHPILPYLMFTQ